ncbi:alpha/beta hydrolase [Candidatus Saganbacteria bacterium]|uniref:Alpha/beta hydrolase n=1 Tax=Candidatus Saganbacteria bacterium TaxID=2575572 RepID=A0A9D6YV74_UNCSA|nr:alpha/beta hydrolase [Candidatus Saganbacteria bacterium]
MHGFATSPRVWSGQEADFAPRLNFENMEAESRKLVESLREKTILVGWSMGGMLAMTAAVQAQDRVCGLVLVSTTPKFIRAAGFHPGLSPVLLRRLERKIEAEGVSAFHKLIFKEEESEGREAIPPARAKKELAELARLDFRGILPQIKIPTLILHGDRDEICPPSAAIFMREKICGSELVIFPGVGHALMLEIPQLFNSHFKKFMEKYAG